MLYLVYLLNSYPWAFAPVTCPVAKSSSLLEAHVKPVYPQSHFLHEACVSQPNPRRPLVLPDITLSLMDLSDSQDSHVLHPSFIRLFSLTGYFLKDRTEADAPVSLYLPRAPNPVPWSKYKYFRLIQQEWNFINPATWNMVALTSWGQTKLSHPWELIADIFRASHLPVRLNFNGYLKQ